MALYDANQTTTPTAVSDYSVSPISPDAPLAQEETYFDNPNFTKWFGKYKSISKIKNSINAYATWVLGKGYDVLDGREFLIKGIDGWGEDTFNSVLWNMLVMKKVNGDSFAQIVRNTDRGQIQNIIPLNPEFMRTVCNRKGRVIRYEYTNGKGEAVKFQPYEILHLCNDRVANEGRGVSIIEAVEWNVEAVEEAKRTHRKMVKRNGVVRVIEVDTEDSAKIAALKVQWKTAIENGDVLIMPKGVAEAKDWHGNLDTAGVIAWLRYLDDDFYTAIGIPKVILGGTADTTEAASKVSYLTFEPIYTRETTELEADLFHQLGISIQFRKPNSMMPTMAADEAKNTGQVGFQPNEMQIGQGEVA